MFKKDYAKRAKKKIRIRKKITGTADRPRMCVFRSLNDIYVQLIDDTTGTTLVSASSKTKDLAEKLSKAKTKVEKSAIVGQAAGELAVEKGIKSVVFDRAGYNYHGRVKSLADGARKAGLKF